MMRTELRDDFLKMKRHFQGKEVYCGALLYYLGLRQFKASDQGNEDKARRLFELGDLVERLAKGTHAKIWEEVPLEDLKI